MPFTAEQRTAIQNAIANAKKNLVKKEKLIISDSELPNNNETNYNLGNDFYNPDLVELEQTPVLTPNNDGTSVISEPDLGEPLNNGSNTVSETDSNSNNGTQNENNTSNEANSNTKNVIGKKPNYMLIGAVVIIVIGYLGYKKFNK